MTWLFGTGDVIQQGGREMQDQVKMIFWGGDMLMCYASELRQAVFLL